MGRTFRRNDRWKKDRKDKAFQKSKKFKEVQHGYHHSHRPVTELPPIEIQEDYDGDGNNSTI